MNKLLLLVPSLLASLALAACGGDENGEEGSNGNGGLPTGDVSREDYIAQADEVCAATGETIDAQAQEYFTDLGLGADERPTPEQTSEFVSEVVAPEIENELDQLRSLEAPEQDAAELAEIYDLVEQSAQRLADDPDAVAEEDPFAEANQRARDYGFEVCGSE